MAGIYSLTPLAEGWLGRYYARIGSPRVCISRLALANIATAWIRSWICRSSIPDRAQRLQIIRSDRSAARASASLQNRRSHAAAAPAVVFKPLVVQTLNDLRLLRQFREAACMYRRTVDAAVDDRHHDCRQFAIRARQPARRVHHRMEQRRALLQQIHIVRERAEILRIPLRACFQRSELARRCRGRLHRWQPGLPFHWVQA